MKKIFAISFLSIMAVVSSNAWATSDTSIETAYRSGSYANNYNIATVDYVKRNAVQSGGHTPDSIVTTNTSGKLQFVSAIDQDQVSGLTDALAGKVDDTQIANAAATVADGDKDTMVPTVQRMANAIADAVSTGVGAVDLSSRVAVNQGTEKANQVLVTGDDGKVTTATTITQAQVENLSTDLAAKFDAANVISDLTELPDGADGTEHVPSYAVYYMTNLLSNSVIAGEETLPFDTNGGDMGTPIVTTLETPDKHSIIDGINSVYNVVKTNKTDIGNKVDKEHVVTSAGTDMANGNNVLESAADNPDDYVPTVGMVDNLAKTMNETLEGKVDIAQGATNKNAIMITNAAGNVIPALVGDCANTTNKCALVTGVDASGNLALQWEVIARNVVQPTVEE